MSTIATNVVFLEPQSGARVEREPDPRDPDRFAYRITGQSRDHVQAKINWLVSEVESFANGYGRFIGPYRLRDGSYIAIGEVVVRP